MTPPVPRPMRRPIWAGARAFSLCLDGMDQVFQREHDPRDLRYMQLIYRTLVESHVVVFSWEQAKVIPRHEDDGIRDFMRDARLPFSPMFIGLRDWPASEEIPVIGAVVDEVDGGLAISPFVEAPHKRYAVLTGTALATPEQEGIRPAVRYSDDVSVEGVMDLAGGAARSICDYLYFLEAANIEIVPLTLIKREQKRAEKRGWPIPLTVQVRRRRGVSPAAPSGEHPDWTHQWEVMGHYKHVTKGPHVQDLSKLKPCSRRDQFGLTCPNGCRREWVPPHIKGPEHKPFVPKMREVVG